MKKESKLMFRVNNCLSCGGTGFYVDSKNKVWKCRDCKEDRIKLDRYTEANIPPRFHDDKLEELEDTEIEIDDSDGNIKIINYKELFRIYLNNIDDFIQNGEGLYLFGTNESGKSTFAYLLIKYILDSTGYTAYCFSYPNLLNEYQKSWSASKEEENRLKNKIDRIVEKKDIILIDDFLFQSQNQNWARELINRIIEKRTNLGYNGKPIIYTSNFSHTQASIKMNERQQNNDYDKKSEQKVNINLGQTFSKITDTIFVQAEFEDAWFRKKKRKDRFQKYFGKTNREEC